MSIVMKKLVSIEFCFAQIPDGKNGSEVKDNELFLTALWKKSHCENTSQSWSY